MSFESSPFSIGADKIKPEPPVTPESLAALGFTSEDGELWQKDAMGYRLSNGDVLWRGNEIANNVRSATWLANMFYNISGVKIA
jgi:hypothetical protein